MIVWFLSRLSHESILIQIQNNGEFMLFLCAFECITIQCRHLPAVYVNSILHFWHFSLTNVKNGWVFLVKKKKMERRKKSQHLYYSTFIALILWGHPDLSICVITQLNLATDYPEHSISTSHLQVLKHSPKLLLNQNMSQMSDAIFSVN